MLLSRIGITRDCAPYSRLERKMIVNVVIIDDNWAAHNDFRRTSYIERNLNHVFHLQDAAVGDSEVGVGGNSEQ